MSNKEFRVEFGGDAEMVDRFNTRLEALVKQFQEDELKRAQPVNHGAKWDEEQRYNVLEMFFDDSSFLGDIAEAMGRTQKSIAAQLDLIFSSPSIFDWRAFMPDTSGEAHEQPVFDIDFGGENFSDAFPEDGVDWDEFFRRLTGAA